MLVSLWHFHKHPSSLTKDQDNLTAPLPEMEYIKIKFEENYSPIYPGITDEEIPVDSWEAEQQESMEHVSSEATDTEPDTGRLVVEDWREVL